MTQKSYWWTTTSVGDGTAEYSRVDHQHINWITGACHGAEGIGPSRWNRLQPTVPAVNTVRIATGVAIVDGKPYDSDAVENITVPSAVGGGNTRIDRIVLRADWTAQTVRITRISGIDAGIPAAPAITQISGTTYDVMICQVLVDTGGNVSVSVDERVYAKIVSNDLEDASIVTSKIGDEAVDTDQLAYGAVTEDKIESLAVTNSKFRLSAGVSVIGRAANSTGAPADIVAGADDRVLARAGGALSWVQVSTAMIADLAVSTAKIALNAITNALLRDSAGVSVIGRAANSSGDPADIVAGANDRVLARSGDVLAFLQVLTAMIANDAVDDTKAGSRIAQFYRRQGFSATNWYQGGTTNYTPDAIRVQFGVMNVSNVATRITFPVAFGNPPVVFATTQAAFGVSVAAPMIASTTTTYVDIELHSESGVVAGTVSWFAIGEE